MFAQHIANLAPVWGRATGTGKSATLCSLISQLIAMYRPRLFIVEAGNSFGLIGDLAKRLGLTVNRVKLSPGSGGQPGALC